VHNNRLNQTLGLSPNQILWGHEVTLLPATVCQTSNEATEEHMTLLRKYQEQAISAIQRLAAESGTPPEQYQVGDAIWLKAKNLKLPHQSSKLALKWYGPFQIEASISPVAYKLWLPTTWNVHPIFHTSLLSPYRKMTTHGPNFTRPPPDLIQGEEEYEVEQIRSHRHHGRSRQLQYLLKWKGYLSVAATRPATS
jgi:hypothetical protein